MASRAIRHVYSEPYNPQQNRKIECFWPPVGQAKDAQLVDQFLGYYNQRPHTSLVCDPDLSSREVYMSPLNAYRMMKHWEEQGSRP
jgi:transposase InsO family protein